MLRWAPWPKEGEKGQCEAQAHRHESEEGAMAAGSRWLGRKGGIRFRSHDASLGVANPPWPLKPFGPDGVRQHPEPDSGGRFRPHSGGTSGRVWAGACAMLEIDGPCDQWRRQMPKARPRCIAKKTNRGRRPPAGAVERGGTMTGFMKASASHGLHGAARLALSGRGSRL